METLEEIRDLNKKVGISIVNKYYENAISKNSTLKAGLVVPVLKSLVLIKFIKSKNLTEESDFQISTLYNTLLASQSVLTGMLRSSNDSILEYSINQLEFNLVEVCNSLMVSIVQNSHKNRDSKPIPHGVTSNMNAKVSKKSFY